MLCVVLRGYTSQHDVDLVDYVIVIPWASRVLGVCPLRAVICILKDVA